jgi:hypothetical protein
LRLNFYRSGLHLKMVDGYVTRVEAWTPTGERDGDAGFVGRQFLPLLFGYRTLDELCQMDRDCWVSGNDAAVLLNVLFPQQPSHVGPLA